MARLDYKDRQVALMVAVKKLGRPLNGEIVKVIDPSLPITEDNIMIFKEKGDLSKYNMNQTGKYIFKEGKDKIINVTVNPDSPFVKTCPVCNKQFVLNDLKNNKTCCSKECSYEYQRKGARRDYIALDSNKEHSYTNKRIPQIRAVAGVKIGRQLLKNEYPYPLDGNHSNLDPDNIIVLSSINDYFKLVHGAKGKYELVLNSDGVTYRTKEVINPMPNKDYKAFLDALNPALKAMQEHIKRELLSGEFIGHNDGNKNNNDISNLTLYDSETSYKNYLSYHPSELFHSINNNANHYEPLKQVVEIHKEGYERTCKYCGNKFYVTDPNNPRQFCNTICRGRWVNEHPQDYNISY